MERCSSSSSSPHPIIERRPASHSNHTPPHTFITPITLSLPPHSPSTEFDGTRSQEGLVQFASTDYEKTEPMPFLFGPFGPMGQLRALLMRSGTWAVGWYDHLTQTKGMKPLMAMATLCVGGLVVGIISLILVGLLFLPKAKMD